MGKTSVRITENSESYTKLHRIAHNCTKMGFLPGNYDKQKSPKTLCFRGEIKKAGDGNRSWGNGSRIPRK